MGSAGLEFPEFGDEALNPATQIDAALKTGRTRPRNPPDRAALLDGPTVPKIVSFDDFLRWNASSEVSPGRYCFFVTPRTGAV